ncbi:MAG: 4a-hydroxytetrahydrobiopterin dehydratase [Burkholderiaceae bacterium]
MSAPNTYSVQEITTLLSGLLRHWQYEEGHICRTYATADWKTSLLVANTIGHLAEAAWHHPDLLVRFPSVTVKLQTHDAGGITDKDLQLAAQIESVVRWRPSQADTSRPVYLPDED